MVLDFSKYPFPERRPRHHIGSAYYHPISQLKVVPSSYPMPLEKVDWQNVFRNGKPPNSLDIGCGRGKFLLEYALANPEENILGLEIKKVVVDWLQTVIQGERIENAGVLWVNVLNGLQFIDDDSISKVFFLFPDPWPKARHHKRRAINLDVLKDFYRIAKHNCSIYLATDILDMHFYHLELLNEFGKFKFNEVREEEDWGIPQTNKQISCQRRGVQYYRIIARKTS